MNHLSRAKGLKLLVYTNMDHCHHTPLQGHCSKLMLRQ